MEYNSRRSQLRPEGSRAPARRPIRWLRCIAPLAAIGLLIGCGQPAATAPTVQAAATQLVGAVQNTVNAVAPTIQAAATQLAPTIQAAQTQVVGAVQGSATAVAPTVQAAGTQMRATLNTGATELAPTVQQAQATVDAALTQVAPTVQAAGTELAPTVQQAQATVDAALTQVAPTVQAAATAVAATVQPPIATSVAASPVQIVDVKVSQDDTTVTLRNSGSSAMNVSQWILSIGTFPLLLPVSTHLQIDPNESVTLHLTRGDDTDEDVYLGQAPDALINSMQPGTSLVLLNRQAEVASIYRLA
jgi:archaellum component FlaF (FlaF/FlaG flagellin family)